MSSEPPPKGPMPDLTVSEGPSVHSVGRQAAGLINARRAARVHGLEESVEPKKKKKKKKKKPAPVEEEGARSLKELAEAAREGKPVQQRSSGAAVARALIGRRQRK